MAIVERFYNNDRARDIRDLLTTNFDNVARYIPHNFISLTTTERQNLPEDWKTHFKLVFDKEFQRVYRWSEIERNWKQYLIYAWDDYARKEIAKIGDTAFSEVQLGINEAGKTDPYTFTFYTREFDEVDGETGKVTHHPRQAVDSVTLAAINVKYNDQYSVDTIITKLINDLTSLDNFVGDRTLITDNENLSASTVTAAIVEVNNKAMEANKRLDSIMDGSTVVPEAEHARRADLADVATLARDSEKLGGHDPEWYASQEDLDKTNDLLDDTITRVTKNESDIAGLKETTTGLRTDLDNLSDTVDDHYQELKRAEDKIQTNTNSISDLSDELDSMRNQIGWEIFMT